MYRITHSLKAPVPLLLAASLVLAGGAWAQSPGGSPKSTQEIIDALRPEGSAGGPAGQRTRGLSLDVPEKKPARVAAGAASAAPEGKFVDLNVPFEFNSDALTEDGRDLLAKLAEALTSKELASISAVTLEGHTDGVGNAEYNRALSLRRAQAVRVFLQGSQELKGKQLRVVGKGAAELANPANPEDGVNRRVRVVVYYAAGK
jgi:outer membrane protein OmpA-like peptidoglycan-associated protein